MGHLQLSWSQSQIYGQGTLSCSIYSNQHDLIWKYVLNTC
ncbi:hypothetical protein DBR06_SOUSAS11410024, partial [Sousa chinensis]